MSFNYFEITNLLKLRKEFFYFLILFSLKLSCQNTVKDTFLIPISYKETCQSDIRLTISGGKYYFNGKVISKELYLKKELFYGKICDTLFDKADGKYCKFYKRDSVIIEEGTWHREYYEGEFRSYFNNGKMKETGFYSLSGDRIGIWYYYNRRGKIIKQITHK